MKKGQKCIKKFASSAMNTKIVAKPNEQSISTNIYIHMRFTSCRKKLEIVSTFFWIENVMTILSCFFHNLKYLRVCTKDLTVALSCWLLMAFYGLICELGNPFLLGKGHGVSLHIQIISFQVRIELRD